jgi:hypothetical protein
MKHLKMMGLAAIAALGLLAFVGAGTASADLYTDEAKTIKYPIGTTIESSLVTGKSAVLKSGSTVIATCTGGSVHGTTETETGTVTGSVKKEDLTWTGCSQTTHTVADGKLSIESNGTVTSSGSQVTLGIFGASCTYGTQEGTTLGTLSSGAEPKLVIKANIPRVAGGFLCPSTGTWEAEYVVTAPHAVFVG